MSLLFRSTEGLTQEDDEGVFAAFKHGLLLLLPVVEPTIVGVGELGWDEGGVNRSAGVLP